jgi:hypothetical protein
LQLDPNPGDGLQFTPQDPQFLPEIYFLGRTLRKLAISQDFTVLHPLQRTEARHKLFHIKFVVIFISLEILYRGTALLSSCYPHTP